MLTKSPIINTLWGDKLLEMTKVIAKAKHFFDQTISEKASDTKHIGVSLQAYIVHVSKAHFLQDMEHTFAGKWQKNALVEALVQYLATEFWQQIDTLPATFGELSMAEKEKILVHLSFSSVQKEVLVQSSLQQLELQISNVLQELSPDQPQIIVETPRWLDKKMRDEIRKRYQQSVLFFHINPAILGGLRIIKAGEMFDYSWLGQVQALAKPLFSL